MKLILFLASYLYSIADKSNLNNTVSFAITIIFALPLIGVVAIVCAILKVDFNLFLVFAIIPFGLYFQTRCSRYVLGHRALIKERNRLLRRPAVFAVALLIGAWVMPILLVMLAKAIENR